MAVDTTAGYIGHTPQDIICGLKPAALNQPYCDDIVTDFDNEIFLEQLMGYELDRHPGQDQYFYQVLKAMGFMMPVCNNTPYGHWERDWYIDTLTVGTIITPGAAPGAEMIFELDPSNMGSSSLLANGGSYAREGFVGHMNVGGVVVNFIITNVNDTTDPYQITVRPLDATIQLDQYLTVGVEFPLVTSQFAKGSCTPKTLVSQNMRYQNTLQIVKEYACSAGSDVVSCTKVKFKLPNGEYADTYYAKVDGEAEGRFKMAIDGAILVGQQNTNGIVQSDINGIETKFPDAHLTGTEGMIPFAQKWGWNYARTPGTFNIQDIYNWDNYIEAQDGPTRYCVFYEHSFGQEFNEAMKDYNGAFVANEYITSNMFNGCKELATFVNYTGFKVANGRSFYFKKLDAFSKTKFLGSAKNYRGYFIAMPVGLMKTPTDSEEMQYMCRAERYVDLNYVPIFGYRYLANKGYNREVEVIHTGGLPNFSGNGTVNTHCDIKEASMRGHFGFHGTRGNLWITAKLPAT